jgi:hypothetical protein
VCLLFRQIVSARDGDTIVIGHESGQDQTHLHQLERAIHNDILAISEHAQTVFSRERDRSRRVYLQQAKKVRAVDGSEIYNDITCIYNLSIDMR